MLLGVLLGLTVLRRAADTVLLSALAVLMAGGIFSDRLPDPAAAVAGFGSTGVATIAVLFVVAAGMTRTGAIDRLTQRLLRAAPGATVRAEGADAGAGRMRAIAGNQLRLMAPVTALSAFLNNTPIVAMALPMVRGFCRRAGLPPSAFMIPLSYAAVLGGTCTLIGTTTNLIVADLLAHAPPEAGTGDTAGRPLRIGFFTPAWVGVPVAAAGLLYMLTLGRRLLPDRDSALSNAEGEGFRRYTAELHVQPGGPLDGQSIDDAGLRGLRGLFLAEIHREDRLMPAVSPRTVLRGGDRLVFVGALEAVSDLVSRRGLVSPDDYVAATDAQRSTGRLAAASQRRLVEAVVGPACPLVGRTIRDGRFRTVYDAVVVAVARGDRRLSGQLGQITLAVGDTLLLEVLPGFTRRHRHGRELYVTDAVDEVDGSVTRHDRAALALAVLGAMIVAVSVFGVPLLVGALLAAGALWLGGCVSGGEARAAIDWRILLALGAALGVSRYVEASGLAALTADGVLAAAALVSAHPVAALAAVYLLTNLFTEALTNAAAAVLMFPIAMRSADQLGADPMPFAIAVMIAASASFVTPLGYQTHLMVMGPGGYRFGDFVRVGLPLAVLTALVALAVIPWAFPL